MSQKSPIFRTNIFFTIHERVLILGSLNQFCFLSGFEYEGGNVSLQQKGLDTPVYHEFNWRMMGQTIKRLPSDNAFVF